MQSSIHRKAERLYEKCFTIEYADVGGVGFSIDIVPAADESEESKIRLRSKSKNPGLIDTAIAIPKHCEKNSTVLLCSG
jgi:hypothetical protein